MKPADRLNLCRKYFLFGFACLPFLWLVNTIWFGQFVFLKKGESTKSRLPRNGSNKSNNRDENNGSSQSAPLHPEQPTTSSTARLRQQQQGPNSPEQSYPPEDPELEAQKEQTLKSIRTYVILSFVGTLIWVIGIVAWVTIYQLRRAEWGEFGDDISFNIPRGIP